MDINFHETILRGLFIFIFRYLVGFFFILQGIRGLKTGYDFVGEEMSPWIFKGGIVIGFLFGIGSRAFSSYGILVESILRETIILMVILELIRGKLTWYIIRITL